ncbi:MAG: hypothetical protein IRY99_20850 [Isosphaeraceae bacterium]|nr:hypothetical protein [Isosphaeraceae bacterium]
MSQAENLQTESIPGREKRLPWMAQVIILTNIFLFGCVAWAYLRFGSIWNPARVETSCSMLPTRRPGRSPSLAQGLPARARSRMAFR